MYLNTGPTSVLVGDDKGVTFLRINMLQLFSVTLLVN